jgi:hypothetical protein
VINDYKINDDILEVKTDEQKLLIDVGTGKLVQK